MYRKSNSSIFTHPTPETHQQSSYNKYISTHGIEFVVVFLAVDVLDVLDDVTVEGFPEDLVLASEQFEEQLKDGGSADQGFVAEEDQGSTQRLRNTTNNTHVIKNYHQREKSIKKKSDLSYCINSWICCIGR